MAERGQRAERETTAARAAPVARVTRAVHGVSMVVKAAEERKEAGVEAKVAMGWVAGESTEDGEVVGWPVVPGVGGSADTAVAGAAAVMEVGSGNSARVLHRSRDLCGPHRAPRSGCGS